MQPHQSVPFFCYSSAEVPSTLNQHLKVELETLKSVDWSIQSSLLAPHRTQCTHNPAFLNIPSIATETLNTPGKYFYLIQKMSVCNSILWRRSAASIACPSNAGRKIKSSGTTTGRSKTTTVKVV